MTVGRFLLAAGVLALAIALWATFFPVDVTFNVTAETEQVDVSPESQGLDWRLSNAVVWNSDGSHWAFSGVMRIASGTATSIQRIGYGPAHIHLSRTDQKPVGSLVDEHDDPAGALPQVLDVDVPDIAQRSQTGESVVFPVNGTVSTGAQAIALDNDTPLLRSGKVALMAVSLIDTRAFALDETTLDLGDRVRVPSGIGAVGFLALTDRPGMAIAYRVVGRQADVIRPGGRSYRLTAAPVARILHDPALQLVWAVVLFLGGGVMKLWPYVGDVLRRDARQLWLLFCVAAMACAARAGAQDVLIKSPQENAQGITKTRGSDCVIITPRHVKALGDGVEVIAAGERRGKASLQRSWDPDLALLRVTSSNFTCDEDQWPGQLDGTLKSALNKTNGRGRLRLREEDGSSRFISVVITDVDEEYVTITPADRTVPFRQTMSGAGLLVGETLVGMLLEAAPQSARVFRSDSASRIMASFLDAASDPSLAAAAERHLSDLSGLWNETGQDGYKIRIEKASAGYKATFSAHPRLEDKINSTDAKLGNVVFTLSGPRGQLRQRHVSSGRPIEVWEYDFDAEVLIYRGESRCQPYAMKGLTASVASTPRYNTRSILIPDFGNVYAAFDASTKQCTFKDSSTPRPKDELGGFFLTQDVPAK